MNQVSLSQKRILVVVIIFAILGLALVGYVKAVPSTKNLIGPRPQIEIQPKYFDFGSVEFGRVVSHSFKVKNVGNKVLEVKRIATSCACTSAKIIQGKIGPGEETELLVSYDTAAMGKSKHSRGRQERIVYLRSNDPVNPQVEVTIRAYVQ